MANVHNAFIEFNRKIGSTPEKRKALKSLRRFVKTDIKQYFKVNRENYAVKFKEQGSFTSKTSILPIDGGYEVGVYIFGKEADRPTSEEAHSWIINALDQGKTRSAVNKKTSVNVIDNEGNRICVRVFYLSTETADDSFFHSADIPKLAHKTKGWIEGGLYASKLWFEKVLRGKGQLKRIIRYLQAWADNQPNTQLPNGTVLSVLALNNYEYHDQDDKALLQTLKNIQEEIDSSRSIWGYFDCKRPNSDLSENLLSSYLSSKWEFLNALDNMIVAGENAVQHESEKEAFAIWQQHLGNRFAHGSDEEGTEENLQYMLPWQLGFRNYETPVRSNAQATPALA